MAEHKRAKDRWTAFLFFLMSREIDIVRLIAAKAKVSMKISVY
jgi:hypothetical protein